ncbi:aminoglycoside phosphotransferase family protein [Arthrobacter sp. ISL-48]|uniref:aminoglycoside phosphotransferase family protein n=1 Tax=Arthrobacter sp. ISL-48 TaxID=2819110 RepID=UPI001BEC119E|nr:aminoglycoside phosphotransferase family protein [Arthrobacter sp. ISL-48]MBT2531346.1 aminoglycoside phosphotransferase family protein [Arthrobacter sp. ISL-48]
MNLADGIRAVLIKEAGAAQVAIELVDGGYSGSVAGVAATSTDSFFFKAVGVDSLPANDYRTEARVARAIASRVPSPRLRFEEVADGWIVLGFDVAPGIMPAEPWSRRQLNAVLSMLDDLTGVLTPSPVAGLPSLADRMRGRSTTWALLEGSGHRDALTVGDLTKWEQQNLHQLAELERRSDALLVGETLLHFDLRHDNLTVDDNGAICILDWGRACTGPAWADVVCLLLESDAGMNDLNRAFLGTARGAAADPVAVDSFLAILASYWRHAATMTKGVPGDLQQRRSASADWTIKWLRHRLN